MKRRYGIFILLIITVVYLYSCSARMHRSILSFFFDGVPPADSDTSGSANTNQGPKPFPDSSLVMLKSSMEEFYYHVPYRENKCIECHDANDKSEIIAPEPDLCYKCHKNFSVQYKELHGPVSGGYCTVCHNPHMAKDSTLVSRTGQLLCLYCHDRKTVLKNEMHSDIGDAACTECHNPHGGDDRYLMN